MLYGLGRIGTAAIVLCLTAGASYAGHRHPARLAGTEHVRADSRPGTERAQVERAQIGHARTSPVQDGDGKADRIGTLVRSVEDVVLHHRATTAVAVPVVTGDDELPAHAAATGEVTRVPYGWADFCGRRPEECRVDVLEPVTIVATPRVMLALSSVNAEANAAIEPVSNLEHWGTLLDHWDYPLDGKGDCKIYALWKRKLLIDRGFPRQALLMTIVRDLEGNGHTILTVKTDRGDFILDNMVGEIRPWDATGYRFVKRQSQADPNVWVSIGQTSSPATTGGLN